MSAGMCAAGPPNELAGGVFIVGAGPGAPDLITVRGLRRLRAAEVVLYDRLVDPLLVAEAPAAAEKVFVGKQPGRAGVGQQAIHELMISRARAGLRVVRLKGGDPFVFGRGAEEAAALQRAGIPFEIVPGLSSALAVPTHAGIALTCRGVARSFTVITGHGAAGDEPEMPPTASREPCGTCNAGAAPQPGAAAADTLVVLMGAARIAGIAAALQRAGRPARTPVAIIERGTTAHQRVIDGTLQDIAARAGAAGLCAPAVIVIGEVATRRHVAVLQPESRPMIPQQAEVCR